MSVNDRYQVGVIGTPDPSDSCYYVLDLVHDFEARVAVAKLIHQYERLTPPRPDRATECRRMLAETMEAHRVAMVAKTLKSQGEEKKEKRGSKGPRP